jgi:hypothetical protein
VHVWNFATGECKHVFRDSEHVIEALAFSAENAQLLPVKTGEDQVVWSLPVFLFLCFRVSCISQPVPISLFLCVSLCQNVRTVTLTLHKISLLAVCSLSLQDVTVSSACTT